MCGSRLHCVTFTFVPGHAGIKGNDGADSLASKATMVDGGTIDRADIRATTVDGGAMDHADILNSIKGTAWNEFLGSELDSTERSQSGHTPLTSSCFAGMHINIRVH